MKLGQMQLAIKEDLENSYGMPFDVRVLPYGEGDYNIEVIPRGFAQSPSISAGVYLSYSRVVFELSVVNRRGIVTPVFRSAQNCATLNSIAISELEDALLEKGCVIKWSVNQKGFKRLSEIDEQLWDIVSLRVETPFLSVYSQFDIHYEVIKDFIVLFTGLIVALSKSEDLTDKSESYLEGDTYESVSIKHERNPLNRALCLKSKGFRCSVCGVDMGERYGKIGEGFIEVHHAVPISTFAEARVVNPEKDLFPLCPNCHAMVHRKNPPYTIDELKAMMKEAGK